MTFTSRSGLGSQLLCGMFAFMIVIGSGQAWAQDKAVPKGISAASPVALPTAESVLEEYVEAIGGKAVLEKITNRRTEGTMEIPAAGIKGKMVALQAAPSSFLLTIDLEGIGKIEQGTDGVSVWEKNPLTGNRMLDGDEKSDMLRRAYFQADANWREVYENAAVKGEEKVGGRAAWVVELKPKSSKNVQTNYYDKETKLLLKTKTQVSTPMGVISLDVLFEDYKDVDGTKVSFTATQEAMGQKQVLKNTKVEHNVKVDASTFAVPKEIKDGKSKS